MGKLIIILVAIIVLAVAFILIGGIDQAQAQETYVWLLPIVHKNFMPHRVGCLMPDSANCTYGPPFTFP